MRRGVSFAGLTEDRGSRVVKTVRVYNPQDKEQYVDVQQINRMVFKDAKSGETWTWSR